MAIGGSMGGMQTLQWAIDFPDRVGKICALCNDSPPKCASHSLQ
ncbi:MAG: alpha/beta fold hydrolase [Bacilli bacterium]